MSLTPIRRRALVEALLVAAIVTAVVTVASAFVPDKYVATVVGFVFLGATWALVWRGEDSRVEAFGLALGGLVLPGKVDVPRLLRALRQALGWSLACALIFYVPFFVGWRYFWHPRGTFHFPFGANDGINEAFGQLVIIALPEEAFYRGYLQSRLDEALPFRVRIFGADVGVAVLVTSVIFALGHFATIREPARLAVFFPSLLFGWLRLRTKGVGAGIAFHAMCNLFSETLGKGFRVY
ncbi:MAG: CPBP family intramembrane metalloprotease [Labilithrix sp.]|nr:CPBP family intramembrane metalloprotease [Labilithrix sp.]MCW5817946.1 CPBP family intramembrane metalloprotease [Labilithrix sp.]